MPKTTAQTCEICGKPHWTDDDRKFWSARDGSTPPPEGTKPLPVVWTNEDFEMLQGETSWTDEDLETLRGKIRDDNR